MKRFLLAAAFIFFIGGTASAHCDSEDGPVVTAAKNALDTGNVNLVLVWVKKQHEPEITDAFNKTLEVRKLGSRAADLADHYFYETVVRLHREGEGAPYTGIKPAGGIEPLIQTADRSVETSSLKELYASLTETMHTNLHHYFEEVVGNKSYETDDVEAGRKFVEAYVKFMHYAENVEKAAGTLPDHNQNNEQSHIH